mgnify:CR=1 FL=1
MTRLQDKTYKQPDYDDVIEHLEDDETFFIGQDYEDYAATTLGCKKCKNTDFKVGLCSYYTAVNCTKCGWQLCIHDG